MPSASGRFGYKSKMNLYISIGICLLPKESGSPEGIFYAALIYGLVLSCLAICWQISVIIEVNDEVICLLCNNTVTCDLRTMREDIIDWISLPQLLLRWSDRLTLTCNSDQSEIIRIKAQTKTPLPRGKPLYTAVNPILQQLLPITEALWYLNYTTGLWQNVAIA